MWKRSSLKIAAKNHLKNSYWLALITCMVVILITSSLNYWYNYYYSTSLLQVIRGYFTNQNTEMKSILPFLLPTAILFAVFIVNPLEAGKKYFFLQGPTGQQRFPHLFTSFQPKHYFRIVRTMLTAQLCIFAWALLLLLPGIYKIYQYRMVPYIITENPSLSPRETLELSANLTQGETKQMILLDLSFVGWFLLGVLGLIVGVLLVIPYYEATWVQLYLTLKQRKTTGISVENPVYTKSFFTA